MIQYSTIPQPLKMKEHQQECSEIDTVQQFREVTKSCSMPSLSSNYQECIQQSPKLITTSATLITDPQTEDTYWIGDDWTIEMDEDVTEMEQPSTAFDGTKSRSQEGGESSLYSFYFETPIHSVSMTDEDKTSHDGLLSITSHNTESDLDLAGTIIDDIWENGLDNPIRANFHPI